MRYSLQSIITITIILLAHPMSYAAERKADTAPTDEYKKVRTTELAQAIANAKKEERAQVIKQHIEKYGINAFWGMPLREAVKLKDKALVSSLLEQRANIYHGDWGEKITHPLYRSGYTEKPTFELAGDDEELLKILKQ